MESVLFDTHIHLDRLPPGKVADEIAQAQAAGVRSFLIPGIDPDAWDRLIEIAESNPGVFLAPGLHPLAAEVWSAAAEERLQRLLSHPAVIAIGEIGLDNKIDVPLDLQERAFRAQLRLAVAAGYPLILHCRGTLNRALQIFADEDGPRVGGILHSFSGSLEIAQRALRLNLTLGFGGVITWPEAKRAPELLRTLPPTAFVLESDAPDQSPEPHRHEQNRPLWLPLIAKRVAALRNISEADLAAQTTANARRILRLDQRISL